MYVCMTLLDYVVNVYNVIGLRVSDKSQPLLSGKRGLYNIHSIKDPEMIELERGSSPLISLNHNLSKSIICPV